MISPRQPAFGVLFNVGGVALQHDQIVEGIDTGFIAGGDQRGEHVGHGRAGQGFEEQRVFAVADDQLQGRFEFVIIELGAFEPAKRRET